MALSGSNPFRTELDELREHYEKAAENVQSLTDMYHKSLELQEMTKARLQEMQTAMDRKILDYQALTENLRQRLEEKDAMISRYRHALKAQEKKAGA